MINPGLAPIPGLGGGARYAVLLAAAMSLAWRSGFPRMRTVTLWTLLLGTAIVVHSALVSPLPEVSLLKAVSWLLAMSTLLAAWGGMSRAERGACERFVFLGLVAVAVCSVPLLGSELGALRNSKGFQGVLNHPQVFGPVMGLLGVWSVSCFLAQRRPNLWFVALAAISFSFVFLSQARTGGMAVVVGFIVGVVTVRVLSGRSLGMLLPGLRSARVWSLGFVLLVAAIASSERIGLVYSAYVTKGDRDDVSTMADAYQLSRGALVDQMLANVIENPVYGIGFGIASNPARIGIERDPVLGLPVSVAVEKGVLPVMIVEELGIPMAVLVGLWVFARLR
jgi:hypothetical protein